MGHESRSMIFLVCLLTVTIPFVRPAESDDDDTAAIALDDMIVDAANSSHEMEFFYDTDSELLKVELDMVISMDEYQKMLDADREYNKDERKKRSAGINYDSMRWTNNILYYQILPHYTGKEIGVILDAVAEWEKHTCVNFVQRNTATNRVQVQKGGGCSSRIGMSGGVQSLSLGNNCVHKTIVMHEFGHALGLFHEQSRPDRDSYIRVNEYNVIRSMLYNFDKKTWSTVKYMSIPYDYISIMHYGKNAFGNGRTTITTLDPAYQDRIGRSQGLSFRDIKSMNIMYNCKRHMSSCTRTDDECPGEGFIGKDCTCWCPGGSWANPIKTCQGDGNRVKTTPAPRPVVTKPPQPPKPVTQRPTGTCEDEFSSCGWWSRQGECNNNQDFMHASCKKSCNTCDHTGGNKGECRDEHYACAKWKKINYCNGRYKDTIQPICKKSCGLCQDDCVDKHEACEEWGQTGYCTGRYKDTIQPLCRKSCGLCKGPTDDCKDEHYACAKWKRINYCYGRYKDIILPVCRKSCGLCGAGANNEAKTTESWIEEGVGR